MKYLLFLFLLVAGTATAAQSCPVTVGSLTLKVTQPRSAGVSPLLAFFDATSTSETATLRGANNTFQDVHYTWQFGDSGASGRGTWSTGANGINQKDRATGPVAAHIYVLTVGGGDKTFTVQVWAYDGINTATCIVQVTAYDPNGSNGFPGEKTTCVSAATKPVAGSGGCPVKARVIQQSNFGTALTSRLGNGKRVLFKCGDTFSGNNVTLSGTKWSVGAYGGCEGTQSNRPIFVNTTTNNYLNVNNNAGDGRIADIAFEGNGSSNLAVNSLWNVSGVSHIPYQITLWNLLSNNNATSYAWAQGAQWGLVGSKETNASGIGTYVNYNQNNPTVISGNPFNNLDYQAILGNSINGVGCCGTGNGIEVMRFGAGRLFVIENNSITNANSVGAVLKVHNGNTYNTVSTWTGVYTEYGEISDNFFGGNSGAQLVETAPQNGGVDERLRFILFERNVLNGSTQAQGGRQLMVSAVNETLRNNVFYMPGSASKYPAWGAQISSRGSNNIAPTGIEVYNNTCYAPNAIAGQVCIGFDNATQQGGVAGNNSFAQNNLFYVPAGGHITVTNNGGMGNTVGNNTSNPALNPSFSNGSGSFSAYRDFRPTVNAQGASPNVPNYFDGEALSWIGAQQLGALSRSSK